MYYVDTSILVSYVFSSDVGHEASRRALEEAARKGKLYASALTFVELYNTLCRRIIGEAGWQLVEPLQSYIELYRDYNARCKLLISMVQGFLHERLGVEFVDDESLYTPETLSPKGPKLPRVYAISAKLSPTLRVRVKDLLHLAYAYALSRLHKIKYLLTRDREDFGRIRGLARQLLGIEVIIVE